MKVNRNLNRIHRKRRVRAKVVGTSEGPRICVFRSLQYLSAQLIDDSKGATLVSVDTRELKAKKYDLDTAKELGKIFAEKVLKSGVSKAVFDRGGYKYHGKVKAFAEGVREKGVKF